MNLVGARYHSRTTRLLPGCSCHGVDQIKHSAYTVHRTSQDLLDFAIQENDHQGSTDLGTGSSRVVEQRAAMDLVLGPAWIKGGQLRPDHIGINFENHGPRNWLYHC